MNCSLRSRILVALLATILAVSAEIRAPCLAAEPKHLTPAQHRILATPPLKAPKADFHFDRPAGPQFTEAEKEAQRQAGKRVVPMVSEAFDRGAESVRIPPGHYRFGKERWDREGVVYALEFSGLKRDADHTFMIDATGATFWFDLPDDQAPTAHFSVGFKECHNIIFRGATLDRGTRGHLEGRLTDFDFAGNRIEIALSPGLTVPTNFSDSLEQRVVPFKSDDTANFHGYWGNIKNIAGPRVTFDLNHEFRRTVLRNAAVGDRLLFHDKTTGEVLGHATLSGIDGSTLVLNKPVDSFTNAIVEWPDHACADWTIQNCHWQDNYQRLLIQSGPGTVRNCTFTRQGSALELNSVMPFVEGGVPRDIIIENNVFTDVNPVPHGAAITVYSHTFARSAPQMSNIIITGNTFTRPGENAIALHNVSGGLITSNHFERPLEYTALARPREPLHRQAIWLSRCANVQVEGNVLNDPGHSTAHDAATGSPVIGCDSHCTNITLNGTHRP